LIVIDTSVAIAFLRGEKSSVSKLEGFQKHANPVAISCVSAFELLYPIHHRKLFEQERVIKSFLHQLSVLSFDSASAEESAKIMGSLLKAGQPVNALDVLIAGTAVANGAESMVSMDRDYDKIAKVSDLRVEILT
jgi:tRNA(fMet)-specific endonuclease VapC